MTEPRKTGRQFPVGLALFGLVLSLGAAISAGRVVLPSLLWSTLFWLGVSLGSLGILLLHRLTGGAWGECLKPALRLIAAGLPLTALLLVPMLLDLKAIYPWSSADASTWWLNQPFFLLRILLYLVLWLVLLRVLTAADEHRDVLAGQGPSGVALVALIVTTSLFAFDWIMSLQADWFSAEFGLLVCAAAAASALALAVLWRLAVERPTNLAPEQLHDLGNLLLACVLLWTYLVFMQFLTVWIANLPREISWFIPRLQTGWRWLGLVVVVVHLLLVLPLLLSRRAKRNPRTLALAAALVVAGQCLYAMWLILPTLRPEAVRLDPSDLILFLGLSAIWLALGLWSDSARRLPHFSDPGGV